MWVGQGVTRWYEFNEKMQGQHQRILSAVGEDAFAAETLRRMPLVLDDQSVHNIATPLGFQMTWLSKGRGAPKAKAAASAGGDIAMALAKAGPAPAAVAPSGVEVPMAPPLAPAVALRPVPAPPAAAPVAPVVPAAPVAPVAKASFVVPPVPVPVAPVPVATPEAVGAVVAVSEPVSWIVKVERLDNNPQQLTLGQLT